MASSLKQVWVWTAPAHHGSSRGTVRYAGAVEARGAAETGAGEGAIAECAAAPAAAGRSCRAFTRAPGFAAGREMSQESVGGGTDS